jgi:hypothetical protein
MSGVMHSLRPLPPPGAEPKPHRLNNPYARRRKHPSIWFLAGPILVGILTQYWDLILLHQYTHDKNVDSIYAVEVAPHLLRPKKVIQLDVDKSWERDTDDDEINKADPEAYFLLNHQNDEDRYDRHTSPDDGDCIAMHSWQEASFPVCNSIHEMDFFSKFRPDGDVTHITHGGFNDLFQYQERFLNETNNDEVAAQSLAVKILKWEKPYSELKFEVVRQDAVTLERLTKSPYIYPIYGYCGFALIVPFFTDGRLADSLSEWKHGEKELSPMTRLKYAVDIAAGLRELHDIDGDGVPSATHGDLKEHQYLFGKDGRLLLGDFNKGTFFKILAFLVKHKA